MSVVAVTGASGAAGRLLVEALGERDDVRRVIGVDVAEPRFGTRNLEFYRLDVRSEAMRDVLRGADVLVHLASGAPQLAEEERRDVNVAGTRCALAAAAEAGVGHVVYRSSALVYGAHPDNDLPLTEDSPVRPVIGVDESAHRAEAEDLVSRFRDDHSTSATVLRPCLVAGARSGGLIAAAARSPFVVRVAGYDPPLQILHESDLVSALLAAMDRRLDGVYNVAPARTLSLTQVAGELGVRLVDESPDEAERKMSRAARLSPGGVDPSWTSFLMYPCVASGDRIAAEGFTAQRSPEDALRDAAQARHGFVSVGPVRVRPRDLAVAAAGVAAVAGSLARRRARKSRPV
ncbi:MAG TPA: NAD-dependent epimerase/dehydratase family protein [Actinomycetota bacterium]|nr:NAD-dependent epimerase/dehydratase family protein [Actinomycetota bacterium]